MKKILINSINKKEIRIALINKYKLLNIYTDNNNYKKKKSNIYKGKIINIEPSLEAVFIDYGENKNGFLPIKEISKKYLKKKLYKGQEIIVQINKEGRINKGASLTTFITLVKNNIILLPNNNKFIGISKKIEGKDRNIIKSMIKKIILPKNMGLIIRTSSLGKSFKKIKLDLISSIKEWKKIKEKFKLSKSPCLIYQDNNILFQILRDYLYEDIKEILIDNYNIYKLSLKYIKKLDKINFINKIKLYKKKIPLFSYFNIENQIEEIYKRIIKLPSGGSIIIDITEALTTIDINSAKSKKWNSIENTALNINLEATKEIARQLCLRDIGGLIVIDFIDMIEYKNKKIIENELIKNTQNDKAKINIGNISKFGLLEMSRQRINKSFKELNCYICSKCNGLGYIRNIKSLYLSILRIIKEKSFKNSTKEIHVIVPLNLGKYIYKKKKKYIYNIKNKKNKKIKILILIDKKLHIPKYNILRIKEKKTNIKNKYEKKKSKNITYLKNNQIKIFKEKNNIKKKNWIYINNINIFFKNILYNFLNLNIFKKRILYLNKYKEKK